MFTGLVEEIGKVKSIQKKGKSVLIEIEANKVLEDVKYGDSICTNGVCLTVTSFGENSYTADVMTETVNRTNFYNLKIGDIVNLERALRVGDRLGGHIVSGHIDGLATIISITQKDMGIIYKFSAESNILKYIIDKGSVTIDGISLTVSNVDQTSFSVSIIPSTMTHTNLNFKKIGDNINIEVDVLGKYVEKLINFSEKKDISMEFLRENGF